MPLLMKPQVKARYYCEQCGTEVRAGASVCPSCGSVFTAVRCPECGYEGRAPEFHAGCPVCGYRTRDKGPVASGGNRAAREKKALPGLFYRVAIAVLAILIIALVIILLLHP
jgi:uncharacterized membrane protein YvbJ